MDGQLSARLIRQLKSEGVDMNAMQQFLCDLNAGKFARTSPVQIAGVPSAMHPDIVDRASLQSYAIPRAAAAAKFRELDLPFYAAEEKFLYGNFLSACRQKISGDFRKTI